MDINKFFVDDAPVTLSTLVAVAKAVRATHIVTGDDFDSELPPQVYYPSRVELCRTKEEAEMCENIFTKSMVSQTYEMLV